MKKIFYLFIILIHCSITYAQEVPKGIFDIRWGDNIKLVKQKMLKQQGVYYVNTSQGIDIMIDNVDIKNYTESFYSGEFLGFKVKEWFFKFIDENLYQISMVFDDGYNGVDLFNEVKNIIIDKYGKPIREEESSHSSWGFINTGNLDSFGDVKYEFGIFLYIDICGTMKKIGGKFKIDLNNVRYDCVNLIITNNKMEDNLIKNYLNMKIQERKKKSKDLQ